MGSVELPELPAFWFEETQKVLEALRLRLQGEGFETSLDEWSVKSTGPREFSVKHYEKSYVLYVEVERFRTCHMEFQTFEEMLERLRAWHERTWPPAGTHPCEACGALEGVELEPSRTAYSQAPLNRFDRIVKDECAILEEDFRDLNAPTYLCRPCATDHHEYWNSQWDEFYASRL